MRYRVFLIVALAVILAVPLAVEAAWVADLTWSPSAPAAGISPVTGTRVDRQVGTALKTVLTTVAPGIAAFTDPGPLTPGTAYTWCLTQTSATGDGPAVCGTRTPLDVPPGVTNFGIQLRFQ